MGQWTVTEPGQLELGEVRMLKVRLIAGSVAVAAGDGPAHLDVERLAGEPLTVSLEDGVLTVSHPHLNWDGLLKLLRPQRSSAVITVRVPRGCDTEVGVLSASATLAGVTGKTWVKSVSGPVTLDNLAGDVSADTVSAALEAQRLEGTLSFSTISGDLTVAGGWLSALSGKTVGGEITADVDLEPGARADLTTVSGAITLRLPASSDTRVSLHTLSGPVRTEFGTLRHSSALMSHAVTGNVGAGRGQLTASSVSGAVTLLKRAGQAATGDGTTGDGWTDGDGADDDVKDDRDIRHPQDEQREGDGK